MIELPRKLAAAPPAPSRASAGEKVYWLIWFFLYTTIVSIKIFGKYLSSHREKHHKIVKFNIINLEIMSDLEKRVTEISPGLKDRGKAPEPFRCFRSAVRRIIASILAGRNLREKMFKEFRERDMEGKMKIIEMLINARQGYLVMECLGQFPEIDPNATVRRLIETDQSIAVILNEFRVSGLDLETSSMVDKEYYRVAPLLFPFF